MSNATTTAHGADPTHGADGHGHDHDEHGPRHYVRIWGILLALLVASVLGPMAGVRIITLMFAFGIAVVKAYLVCKHFMHLNVQPRFVAMFLAAALGFMFLMFFGVSPDVLHHSGQRWENLAAQAEIERGLAEAAAHAAPPPPPAFDAAETFATTCGPCHGVQGRGDGAAGAGLPTHPANFTDPAFWQTRDRAHVIATITGGGASVGRSPLMPAFGTAFTAQQIEEIADHVVSFRP
jgi:caa(3)-type oxidase subunit IV